MHAHTQTTDEKCLFLKQALTELFRGLLKICKDVTSVWFSEHNYLNIEPLTTLKAPESLKLLLTIRKKLVPFRKTKYGQFFFTLFGALYGSICNALLLKAKHLDWMLNNHMCVNKTRTAFVQLVVNQHPETNSVNGMNFLQLQNKFWVCLYRVQLLQDALTQS